jgi:hypothetical protein
LASLKLFPLYSPLDLKCHLRFPCFLHLLFQLLGLQLFRVAFRESCDHHSSRANRIGSGRPGLLYLICVLFTCLKELCRDCRTFSRQRQAQITSKIPPSLSTAKQAEPHQCSLLKHWSLRRQSYYLYSPLSLIPCSFCLI